MTNPTPEELKLVAEYMGLESSDGASGGVVVLWPFPEHDEWVKYNPLTNAEQSMELLKMLLDKGARFEKSGGKYLESFLADVSEESLELAIFNAALAHIKGSTKAEKEVENERP